CQQYHSEPWTF
nr:immunoglobulin light chain junction region [Macaca mulatta]